MRAPGDRDLLMLWEQGIHRHPLDRALLLAAWARPELTWAQLASLPLGSLNTSLLRLREAYFGSRIDAIVDCERCGERMELALEIGELLEGADDAAVGGDLELCGYRFRAPDSHDLAAVALERDPEVAALRLTERCCLGRPQTRPAELASLLDSVEAGLEALDPAADFSAFLSCEVCGHEWTVSLHVGELLWEEVDARARQLLEQVHGLARAYGWTESDVLELSSQRRAEYLELVGG